MRDWEKNPPENMDDARELARQIAQEACDSVFKETGERPHYEEEGDSIFIIWPDGMRTNEIKVIKLTQH